MLSDLLDQLQGRSVLLRFSDGHVVKGNLLGVYADEDEFIYEIQEILEMGPPRFVGAAPGTVAMAKLSELADVTDVPGDGA